MTIAKIKDLVGKLKGGDTFWYRVDVRTVREDGYLIQGENGTAINGWLLQDKENGIYTENEVMVDPDILDRNDDELIEIDGKKISKAMIKAALAEYVK